MYQVEFERTLFDNLYKEYRRKDLPDNVLAYGNPAKIIRRI